MRGRWSFLVWRPSFAGAISAFGVFGCSSDKADREAQAASGGTTSGVSGAGGSGASTSGTGATPSGGSNPGGGAPGDAGQGGAAGAGDGGTGNDETGRVSTDTFKRIGADRDHSCGVRSDDTLVCWGGRESLDGAPTERVIDISVGGASCAILANEDALCWWDGTTERLAGPFRSVADGGGYSCGLLADGSLTCWGDDDEEGDQSPGGAYTSVSMHYQACAVRTDDTLHCWTWAANDYIARLPPPGTFRKVSLGVVHACAIRSDASLVCWGSGNPAGAPNGGTFRDVSSARSEEAASVCAIHDDGRLSCWGAAPLGESEAPPSAFTSVSTGWDHACALRDDGHVVCWGSNANGKASPP